MNLPTYLTIDHFYKLQNIQALKTPEDIVNVICLISGEDRDNVLQLPKEEIDTTTKALVQLFNTSQPKFWPIFQYKDIVYGFQPLSKMTLGEWIDCDAYAKDWKTQLHKLLAVCYRPITKHHHKSWVWRTKYNIKVWSKENVSPFSVYDIEPYNSETAIERSELFKELPIEIAQGSLAFFLAIGMKYTESTLISLLPNQEEKDLIISTNKKIIESLYSNTMVGS